MEKVAVSNVQEQNITVDSDAKSIDTTAVVLFESFVKLKTQEKQKVAAKILGASEKGEQRTINMSGNLRWRNK